MKVTQPKILESIAYSDDVLSRVREGIEREVPSNKQVSIITVGSVARKDCSKESDLDYYIIHNSEVDKKSLLVIEEKLKSVLEVLKLKLPSSGGAFGSVVSREELTKNIGGNDDNTVHLTRRILYLMESDWLYNQALYEEIFKEIINCYVQDSITQHALCRFLLNDLIRYYRTICVDFEFKTVQNGKSWGDRNIKLAFARKLMYFSGIVAIAETVQNTPKRKRNLLYEYLRMTPVQRVSKICGRASQRCLDMYDEYVSKMADSEVRTILRNTTVSRDHHHDQFRELKNLGHHFSWELTNLLDQTYPSTHPIHLALRM